MTRAQVLNQLVDLIVAIQLPHPTRVAIDGIDASGKTMLADELVEPISRRGRTVIRASIDGFHRPRAERYRRGKDSPEGYYYDSFDYNALRANLLGPLGLNGSRWHRRATFDYRTDSSIDSTGEQAAPDAILLFDGVFLLRPELRDLWDFSIFLHVDFKIAIARAVARDLADGRTSDEISARYRNRYVPGQQLYFGSAYPQSNANSIIENNDLENPRLEIKR
ncbi:MAG: uridine kinase [Chloroflexi bacterium]|nr:uridine kinase [Chloroflexota bacterium]